MDIRYDTPMKALKEPLRKYWETSMAMYPVAYSSRPTPEDIANSKAARDLYRAIASLVLSELKAVRPIITRIPLWEAVANCDWENGSLVAASDIGARRETECMA